jgi:hypothetical protein
MDVSRGLSTCLKPSNSYEGRIDTNTDYFEIIKQIASSWSRVNAYSFRVYESTHFFFDMEKEPLEVTFLSSGQSRDPKNQHRNFSVLPPMCRRGARPGLPPPDALPEVPPPSRTPLSGYPAAALAAGHPCPGALAAGHEASSAVVTPSRQYKRPAGGGPAADTAGPGVFLPSLARMNWPDGD